MKAGDMLHDRYQLIEELGRGGFGVVWRAADTRLGRGVAVKVISDQYAADPRDIRRFGDEARAVARLNHPHIVTLHDLAVAPTGHYLVMELITGRSLAAVRKEGRPDPAQAVGWISQVCSALDAAHRAKVVHRDIKPENIMLTAEGEAKVLDFGIARLESQSSGLTSTGTVIGSPLYLAPERWSGGPVDGRTDLYAVGVVLYELCTGRKPFDAETTVSLMYQHLDSPPPAPRTVEPALPVELDALILDLLAKAPADRPADAAEVCRRLASVRFDRADELRARADAAWALGAGGDPAGAVRALGPLIADFARLCGPDDPRTLRTRHDLALWLAADGDLAAALDLLRDLAAVPGGIGAAAAVDLARFERRLRTPDSAISRR